MFCIFEVVNILLSYGANPQQTNTKRKTPLDLINSKEMSDVFNLHGVKHTAIENTARKVPSKEPPDSLDSAMNVQVSIVVFSLFFYCELFKENDF